MNNTYVKQKLDELHLIDDFLFFQMMNHPKYGPKFSRLLLKLILGREVGKLHVIPQKEYYGEDTDSYWTWRMKVFLVFMTLSQKRKRIRKRGTTCRSGYGFIML